MATYEGRYKITYLQSYRNVDIDKDKMHWFDSKDKKRRGPVKRGREKDHCWNSSSKKEKLQRAYNKRADERGYWRNNG